jgi:hypothetical protein
VPTVRGEKLNIIPRRLASKQFKCVGRYSHEDIQLIRLKARRSVRALGIWLAEEALDGLMFITEEEITEFLHKIGKRKPQAPPNTAIVSI